MQVSMDLGIADHVWQDKRTAIAQSVDALGDQFKPVMSAGWMQCIRQTYPAGAVAPLVTIEESSLVLDDEWVLDTRWWMFQMASFLEWIMNTHPNCNFEIWNNQYNNI